VALGAEGGLPYAAAMIPKPASPRKLLTRTARLATLVVVGVAETACNLQLGPPHDAALRGDAGSDAGTDAGSDAGSDASPSTDAAVLTDAGVDGSGP